MIFILILFSILLLIIFKKVYRDLKFNGWSCNSYFLIFFILFYVISPIVYILYELLDIKYFSYFNLVNDNIYIFFVTFIIILFSYLTYLIGYNLTRNKTYVFISEKYFLGKKIIDLFYYFLFVISSVSLVMYIYGFGGFEEAVKSAALVRSFNYIQTADGDTSHTFYFRFIFLAIIPFLIFLYKKRHNQILKFDYLVLVGIIFCLIILYIYLSPGRQRIIDFILIFVLSSLLIKNKFFEKKLGIIVLLVLFFIPFYEYITQSIFEREVNIENISIIDTLINEFNFPFFSLIASLNFYGEFSYFNEFITHLYGTFLPSSLNPFTDIDSINYKNTYYLSGIYDKFIPPGIVAYGFYSFGFFGVFIVSFFTGVFLKVIDNFFKINIRVNRGFAFFYSLIILLTLNWIRTGLPKNFFYYTVFVSIFLVLLFSFRYKKYN